MLREKGLLPELEPKIDFVVMAFNAQMRVMQVAVAAKLRQVPRLSWNPMSSHEAPICPGFLHIAY